MGVVQNEEATEEDKRKFSGNILSTTYQMRSLVENILEMVRVDNGTVKMDFPLSISASLSAMPHCHFNCSMKKKDWACNVPLPMGLPCMAVSSIYTR